MSLKSIEEKEINKLTFLRKNASNSQRQFKTNHELKLNWMEFYNKTFLNRSTTSSSNELKKI